MDDTLRIMIGIRQKDVSGDIRISIKPDGTYKSNVKASVSRVVSDGFDEGWQIAHQETLKRINN